MMMNFFIQSQATKNTLDKKELVSLQKYQHELNTILLIHHTKIELQVHSNNFCFLFFVQFAS